MPDAGSWTGRHTSQECCAGRFNVRYMARLPARVGSHSRDAQPMRTWSPMTALDYKGCPPLGTTGYGPIGSGPHRLRSPCLLFSQSDHVVSRSLHLWPGAVAQETPKQNPSSRCHKRWFKRRRGSFGRPKRQNAPCIVNNLGQPTCFTRRRSQVRGLSRPPCNPQKQFRLLRLVTA